MKSSYHIWGDVIKGNIHLSLCHRGMIVLSLEELTSSVLLILDFFLFDSCLSAKDGHSAFSLSFTKQHRKLCLCSAIKGLQGSNRKPHLSGSDFVLDLGHTLCLFFLEMELIFTCVSFLGCISNVEMKKGLLFVQLQHYKIYLYFIK